MSTTLRRRLAGHRNDQRGSGSLLMLSGALLLLFVGVAAVLWAVVSTGRHRAATAADLSALSAAQALQAGDPQPCRTASRIAATHQAEITRCEVTAETVTVTAAVHLNLATLGKPSIESTARAGPTQGTTHPLTLLPQPQQHPSALGRLQVESTGGRRPLGVGRPAGSPAPRCPGP